MKIPGLIAVVFLTFTFSLTAWPAPFENQLIISILDPEDNQDGTDIEKLISYQLEPISDDAAGTHYNEFSLSSFSFHETDKLKKCWEIENETYDVEPNKVKDLVAKLKIVQDSTFPSVSTEMQKFKYIWSNYEENVQPASSALFMVDQDTEYLYFYSGDFYLSFNRIGEGSLSGISACFDSSAEGVEEIDPQPSLHFCLSQPNLLLSDQPRYDSLDLSPELRVFILTFLAKKLEKIDSEDLKGVEFALKFLLNQGVDALREDRQTENLNQSTAVYAFIEKIYQNVSCKDFSGQIH